MADLNLWGILVAVMAMVLATISLLFPEPIIAFLFNNSQLVTIATLCSAVFLSLLLKPKKKKTV